LFLKKRLTAQCFSGITHFRTRSHLQQRTHSAAHLHQPLQRQAQGAFPAAVAAVAAVAAEGLVKPFIFAINFYTSMPFFIP
jgi:hypothetical protein